MSAIFKTLTGIIPSKQTAIVFTDSMILEDSILDVFFSNDDIVVDDMTMSGNSVTVTISPQNYNVGVALFINNCEIFTPYDDTEVLNRLTINETDIEVINTDIEDLNTSLNNKQDKLPEVVKDRYLHTNVTTGAFEWSEVQGGSNNNNLVVRVTCSGVNGWSEYTQLPSQYSADDYIPISITTDTKRVGQNVYDGMSTSRRCFTELTSLGVRVYNQEPSFYNRLVYVTLQKIDNLI